MPTKYLHRVARQSEGCHEAKSFTTLRKLSAHDRQGFVAALAGQVSVSGRRAGKGPHGNGIMLTVLLAWTALVDEGINQHTRGVMRLYMKSQPSRRVTAILNELAVFRAVPQNFYAISDELSLPSFAQR